MRRAPETWAVSADLAQAAVAIRRCRELRHAGRSEAVLRGEFLSRLRLIFPDQVDEVWINHYSEGTEAGTTVGLAEGGVASRFIDNLVGSTAIEYESDLRIKAKRDEGLSQVREQVSGLVRDGMPVSQVRGILSDTVDWYVFDAELAPGIDPTACTVEDITLVAIDELQLTAADPSAAARLTAFVRRHLAREQSRIPTAAFLTLDLGLDSVSYARSASLLRKLVDDGRAANPSIRLATDLWSEFVDYLEGVAGRFRAEAYVDEIYLCVLARLLIANVLTGQAMSSVDGDLKAILDGSFFQDRFHLANMVEQDYFGWLTEPAHIDRLAAIARWIQQDLYAYDFSRRPEEDLFGQLMAQLARHSQRKLLGQEWTPAWLGRRLTERCLDNLPTGQQPRIVDMCCGSGSILAEILKAARARYGLDGIVALRDVATGFDIDPLAVSLAKTAWVISLVDEIREAVSPIVIPIYHADSLFSVTPITLTHPFLDDADTVPVSLDGEIVDLPAALVRPEFRELFDRIIDWAYDEATDAQTQGRTDHLTEQGTAQFIDGATAASGISLNPKFQQELYESVFALVRRMAALAVLGRNGIWAFILRNTYRPGLLGGQFNGLVSNPPWLALSRLAANPYRDLLTDRARAYGIRPSGQSFLHLELGTTHLLHAVDRYLSPDASVACLVPGTVFNGHHHELFRRREFLRAPRPVALDISEVWQVEPGTFKYPGAAVVGRKRSGLAGPARGEIHGFLATQEDLAPTDFSVRTLGDERTAWVLEKKGMPAATCAALEIPHQGADLMPRTAVCIEILTRTGREFRVNTPGPGSRWAFTVQAAKALKGARFHGHVAPEFIYRMAQSENLLPFVFGAHCAPPVALPVLRGNDGTLGVCDESEIRRIGLVETARRFRAINAGLAHVGKGASLQARIDVRRKLTKQVLRSEGYLLLAGAGGKHICAACVPLAGDTDLIVDQTLYWRVIPSEAEACYCVGMLCSHAMTEAIRPFNPRGAFGERHIHALPYRLMPAFDPGNDTHQRIGDLARCLAGEAQQVIAGNDYLQDPHNPLTARRTRLRERLQTTGTFTELDQYCSAVLGMTAAPDVDGYL